MKPVKKALLLHDLCGVGKAALTNMLPVLGSMGIEACPVPTVLLSTHTGGYGLPAICPIPADYICKCADHYVSQGILFDVIFIGYIGTNAAAEAVQYFLSCFPDTLVIMDPIMGDHGKFYSNFGPEYLDAVKKLLPASDILLPNLTEACLLSDVVYDETYSPSNLLDICRTLDPDHKKSVVITSVPAQKEEKAIAVYEEGRLEIFRRPNAGREYHGSGDVFDAVFTGSYLRDLPLKTCVNRAHDFVSRCIRESMKYDYEEKEGLLIEKTLARLV